jgi:hypothetical protein
MGVPSGSGYPLLVLVAVRISAFVLLLSKEELEVVDLRPSHSGLSALIPTPKPIPIHKKVPLFCPFSQFSNSDPPLPSILKCIKF